MKPCEEIAKFIAEAAGKEKLAGFHPSLSAARHLTKLLTKQKAGILSAKENEELQLLVKLDHVMSLAKAFATLRIKDPI
ncbi:hypothetical protein [Prosthecobacter dejongeii]|uniref:Uncharacterized protein n=1 Tax=Prosthecobacter dejongeii TaxID=48465 RepID=A0A7W8DS58_9BACT|nr:hypothetical protein [Prosthecobacter dejongeii]MBB5040293.1 hypothetical protein [Prosthecobacter dejongeii]